MYRAKRAHVRSFEQGSCCTSYVSEPGVQAGLRVSRFVFKVLRIKCVVRIHTSTCVRDAGFVDVAECALLQPPERSERLTASIRSYAI